MTLNIPLPDPSDTEAVVAYIRRLASAANDLADKMETNLSEIEHQDGTNA